MNMKVFGFAVIALSAGVAQARELKPFQCETQLDYVVRVNGEKVVRTVDLVIEGQRSETNTLAGGLGVSVGSLFFKLNLPSVSLSPSVVIVKGTNTKEQASLSFAFLTTADGSQNSANRASVSVRTQNGVLTATNEILGTEDVNDAYDINCTIVQ